MLNTEFKTFDNKSIDKIHVYIHNVVIKRLYSDIYILQNNSLPVKDILSVCFDMNYKCNIFFK